MPQNNDIVKVQLRALIGNKEFGCERLELLCLIRSQGLSTTEWSRLEIHRVIDELFAFLVGHEIDVLPAKLRIDITQQPNPYAGFSVASPPAPRPPGS